MGIGVNFIGRKIGEEIKKFVQLVFEARKDDNRNALLYNSAGEDSVPLNDERLILVKVDGAGKYAAVAVLTQSQGANPGEKIFFARDPDAAIVSKVSMLNDGSVTVEADGDITHKTKKNFNYSSDGDSVSEIGGVSNEKIKGDKVIDSGGKVYIGGSADNICKLLLALIDELIGFETFGPPPQHKTHPSTVAKLNIFKEKIKALFLESA